MRVWASVNVTGTLRVYLSSSGEVANYWLTSGYDITLASWLQFIIRCCCQIKRRTVDWASWNKFTASHPGRQ